MDTTKINSGTPDLIPSSPLYRESFHSEESNKYRTQRENPESQGGVPVTKSQPLAHEPGKDLLSRLSQGTAERLHQVASSFRDQSTQYPDLPIAKKIATNTADAIDSTASYLEHTSTESLKEGVSSQIKKHPLVTVGMALGLGLWLGRNLGRR